eukprot:219521-Pleurochrysis_carterae.AAC.1
MGNPSRTKKTEHPYCLYSKLSSRNRLQPASGETNVIACTIDLNCLQPIWSCKSWQGAWSRTVQCYW